MMEDKELLQCASDLAQAKEKIMAWCKAEDMELPKGTLFQLVPCDVAELRLVRVNVFFPETVLRRIDTKAQLAGMSRSAFLARAARHTPDRANSAKRKGASVLCRSPFFKTESSPLCGEFQKGEAFK